MKMGEEKGTKKKKKNIHRWFTEIIGHTGIL